MEQLAERLKRTSEKKAYPYQYTGRRPDANLYRSDRKYGTHQR